MFFGLMAYLWRIVHFIVREEFVNVVELDFIRS